MRSISSRSLNLARRGWFLSPTFASLGGNPLLAFLMIGVAAGCTDGQGPEAQSGVRESQPVAEKLDLSGTSWQVEDIDGGGIIDRSNVTIEIASRDGIAGSAGCNRYFGGATITDFDFRVLGLGNTSMACVPAMNAQEIRFLDALQQASRYTADANLLRIYDDAGTERIRAVRRADEPGAATQPADKVTNTAERTTFECGGDLTFTVKFVGPETVTVTLVDGEHTLQQERTASGARYAGDGIVFWNKGQEAMLDIGGVGHTCKKS